MIALHHLDVGWKPSDLEQREGRIIRQGNMNKKVHIYRYVTEATFDSYMWQLIESKQKFISQIMTSKSPVRSCENVDDTALSYAEVKARFPEEFRFQLTEKETESLRSQIATSMKSNGDNEKKGGRRYLPYAFTEQGIAMLSAVLRSDVAIQVSINIMNAFVEMRRFIANNSLLFERISNVELKQLEYQIKLMKSLSRYLST